MKEAITCDAPDHVLTIVRTCLAITSNYPWFIPSLVPPFTAEDMQKNINDATEHRHTRYDAHKRDTDLPVSIISHDFTSDFVNVAHMIRNAFLLIHAFKLQCTTYL